jgi:hypothetical protein
MDSTASGPSWPATDEVIVCGPDGLTVEQIVIRPAPGEVGTLRDQLDRITRPRLRVEHPM